MSTNNMTPMDALRVLDIVTLPSNIGKLSRQDYANTESALLVLAEFVKANQPKDAPEEPKKEG